jgi:hypothetical protein
LHDICIVLSDTDRQHPTTWEEASNKGIDVLLGAGWWHLYKVGWGVWLGNVYKQWIYWRFFSWQHLLLYTTIYNMSSDHEFSIKGILLWFGYIPPNLMCWKCNPQVHILMVFGGRAFGK